MRRDSALVPVSREHHSMLMLAQLLKRDTPAYKGLPTDSQGKLQYAARVWEEIIVPHIELEERVIFATVEAVEELQELVAELKEEHARLRKQWAGLQQYPQNMEMQDTFGRILEAHIRKEERQFFEALQKCLSAEQMAELGKKIRNGASE